MKQNQKMKQVVVELIVEPPKGRFVEFGITPHNTESLREILRDGDGPWMGMCFYTRANELLASFEGFDFKFLKSPDRGDGTLFIFRISN